MQMFTRKKRIAPAGPKQNTRRPRKSTGRGSPLNRPAPNPTGGVAGGPSAPTRRPKPKTAKRKSPFAKGTPSRNTPRYTTMPVKGRPAKKAPRYTTMPVRKPKTKTGGIAMSEAARKAMAFRKVEEAKKAARLKRTGKSLATAAAQVRARKKAASRYGVPIRGEKELAGKKAASRKRIPISGAKELAGKKAASRKRIPISGAKEAAARAGAKRKRRAVVSRRPAASPRRRPTGGYRRPGMGRRR